MAQLFAASFLAFVGLLGSHPAPAVSGLYQPGTVYTYTYETGIRLNELPNSGREVGYKVSGTVQVSSVWQNGGDPSEKLLKVELLKPKLHVHAVHTPDHHLEAHASPLDKSSQQPAYLHWHRGRVLNIYLPVDPKDVTVNLKKGVASLFQLQPSGGEATDSNPKLEDDVSGRCQVTYTNEIKGKVIHKTKSNCQMPTSHEFTIPNGPRSINVTAKSNLIYELLPNNAVKNVEAREAIEMSVNLWSKAAVSGEAQTRLGFVEEKEGSPTVTGKEVKEALTALFKKTKYDVHDLTANVEPRECSGTKCKSLAKVIQEYKDRLKSVNIGKVKSANAFLRVLEKMRHSEQKEIQSALVDKKNKDIFPQLLDAAAFTQTDAAIKAGISAVNFAGEDLNIPERFLLTLSLASHPNEVLIGELLKVLSKAAKNEKIETTALVALGSVTNTFCLSKGPEVCTASKSVQEVRNHMVKNLVKCGKDNCRLKYLRGLINLASQETVDTLILFAKKGGKVGASALTALLKVGPEKLKAQDLKQLAEIYHQLRKPYDTTARLLAIEIVFQSKSSNMRDYLKQFFYSLSNQLVPEVSTFALAKLRQLEQEDPNLMKAIKEVAKDSSVWNYYTLSQKGGSTSFSRLLAETGQLNATYGVTMEMIPGGLVKRSSFDVHMVSGDDQLRLLSVGLFGEGLSSFGGGGDDEPQEAEQEETSAGMELTIMGVKLRPYTFFTGTSELMGHVWSGTGSELTPAVQSNFLIQDHQVYVPLHNGLVADCSVLGALSTDLSGSIQISLWNRNSHSLVKSTGALLMHGALRLDTQFAKSHVEFAMGGESLVDFMTDLDFYEKPSKTCIQMDQPAFSFRYNVRKAESVPSSKHMVRTLRKRTVNVAGKSYALHQKNFASCAAMLSKNE